MSTYKIKGKGDMIRLTHDIFCDTCLFWEQLFISNRKETKRARKMAKKAGWTTVGSKDICPACSKDNGA